jgi:hypothetical protein
MLYLCHAVCFSHVSLELIEFPNRFSLFDLIYMFGYKSVNLLKVYFSFIFYLKAKGGHLECYSIFSPNSGEWSASGLINCSKTVISNSYLSGIESVSINIFILCNFHLVKNISSGQKFPIRVKTAWQKRRHIFLLCAHLWKNAITNNRFLSLSGSRAAVPMSRSIFSLRRISGSLKEK